MSGRASWAREPHGTEARAKRHRRAGEKPCAPCLAAESAAAARRHGITMNRSEAQLDVWARRRAGLLPERRRSA